MQYINQQLNEALNEKLQKALTRGWFRTFEPAVCLFVSLELLDLLFGRILGDRVVAHKDVRELAGK